MEFPRIYWMWHVVFHKVLSLGLYYDLPAVSKKLKFYLFADDTNIYFDADRLEKIEKSSQHRAEKS